MSSNLKISIIICTYNRASLLRDSLISLLENNVESSTFEIIVIDNNSSDNTSSVVEEVSAGWPAHQIRYIRETQQGLSFARNRGIKEAGSSLLLFIDDDILTDSEFIKTWIHFFDSHPDAAGAGGKIKVHFDDPSPDWMSSFLMPLLGHHDLGNKIKKYGRNKYPFGGNMVFRETVFDRFGLFKTDLGRKGTSLFASEEKEFYNRIRTEEQAIYYIPQALIYHRVNKARLTKEYIRRQAIGLGQSIYLQLRDQPWLLKAKKTVEEIAKLLATLVLFAGYTVSFQYPKAEMLLKFRFWIYRGIRNMGSSSDHRQTQQGG